MALKLVQAFDDYNCTSNELFGICYNFFFDSVTIFLSILNLDQEVILKICVTSSTFPKYSACISNLICNMKMRLKAMFNKLNVFCHSLKVQTNK